MHESEQGIQTQPVNEFGASLHGVDLLTEMFPGNAMLPFLMTHVTVVTKEIFVGQEDRSAELGKFLSTMAPGGMSLSMLLLLKVGCVRIAQFGLRSWLRGWVSIECQCVLFEAKDLGVTVMQRVVWMKVKCFPWFFARFPLFILCVSVRRF